MPMLPDDPLRYPPHYPPTKRWQRFFIGVRWLGPDLSFFKQLAAQQGSRSSRSMDYWGGGDRTLIAAETGAIFSRRLRWPSPYFLPGDSVAVIVGGPRFASMDGDLDVEDAIGEIEELLGVTTPRKFWQDAGALTLAELVDQLLAAGATPQTHPSPDRLTS